MASLQQKVDLCRTLVRTSHLVLMASLIVNWWFTDPALRSMPVLLVLLLPLAILFGGVWRGNTRAHFWLCVVLMPYVIKAIMNLLFGDHLVIALLETLSSGTLFFAAVYFVKWEAQLAATE
ncbi:MAG: DUF2069 domain-containing protein [Halioglobus sp.]|nr:DUF2069 domain-containing protein [Halioglobus sp.]